VPLDTINFHFHSFTTSSIPNTPSAVFESSILTEDHGILVEYNNSEDNNDVGFIHSPPVDALVGLHSDVCVSVTELMSDVNESLKADEDIISHEELLCERNSLAVILEDSEEYESSAGEEDESNQDSDVAFSGHESETKSDKVRDWALEE